jgi:hypothetical protein
MVRRLGNFFIVDDAADGIVLAAERYDGSEPVNLGSGQEISIRDLAQIVAAEVGFSGSIEWDTAQPNGQPRRCLDVSKAQRYSRLSRPTRPARRDRNNSRFVSCAASDTRPQSLVLFQRSQRTDRRQRILLSLITVGRFKRAFTPCGLPR